MKLEVGQFVRTEDGLIAKYTGYKKNNENDIDGFRTINEFGESNEILELLDILKEVE